MAATDTGPIENQQRKLSHGAGVVASQCACGSRPAGEQRSKSFLRKSVQQMLAQHFEALLCRRPDQAVRYSE
jgi:hypothetical protein